MTVFNPTVSVVIPAHNEANNLARTLPLLQQCPQMSFHEIIVVDDGSTDGTAGVVQEAARADPRIRCIVLTVNQGKGAAVKTGLLAATGDVILYTDADLIYQLRDLPDWIAELRDVEMVNGNRRLPDSVFFVPTRLFPYVVKRARLGLVFNALVRLLLPIMTRDTQSGLKLYRCEVAQRLARHSIENHFAFDAEFFALAHTWGYRVADVPVQLDYRDEVSRVRLLRDGWRMFRAVLAIRRRLRRHQGEEKRTLIVTADDYGFSDRVSEGILQAHTEGMVNAVSVLVNFPGAPDAVACLKTHPELSVGIHLNATVGPPLLSWPPGVLQMSGGLSRPVFLRAYLRQPRRTLRWLEAEWDAQIRRLQQWGIPVRHLDSHHHLHVLPGVQAIAIRLAKQHRIPRVRAPRDPAFLRSPLRAVLYCLSQLFALRARKAGLAVTDHFRGGAVSTARNKAKALRKILAQLPPGTTEIYCHPGHPDTALPDGYNTERGEELAALTEAMVPRCAEKPERLQ